MIWSALRRLIQRYGFFKREPVVASVPTWQEHPFFSEAAHKSSRLAQIARERAWLYENKAELLAKRKGFYVRLRALKNAEMAVEQGKPEPGE